MQARAPNLTERYHAPTSPQIPLQAVQALIPRLTTTINDIDSFNALLAQGAQDGTLPNWEILLQRYSLLLGRINAISTYIAQHPLPPTTRPGIPALPKLPSDTRPSLERYLVHPLNPLPANIAQENPIAPDVFFQLLNTQNLPSLLESQAELLSLPLPPPNASDFEAEGSQSARRGREKWTSMDDLRKMDDRQLEILNKRLKDRLESERSVIEKAKEMFDEQEEEYDWGMRIGGDAEDEAEAVEDGDGKDNAGTKDDKDDDLFDDGEDDLEEVKVIDKLPEKPAAKPTPKPGPREGWKLSEYIRYMDSGKRPA